MELTIDGVGKRYRGDVWGLREFSLDIGPGILGLLGPNGAGKSTLMRVLATITKPTTGTARWNGSDIKRRPNKLRAVLGYLPQDFGVYANLNPQEFLHYIAAIKGVPAQAARRRIGELLVMVNLTDAARRPLGGFSGGMRQRVGIAQALLNDPELLIVDEPTAGLDPEERVRFRHLLSELSGERVVILSTHIVSDIEATATRIALVNQGRLLRCEAPEDLLKSVAGKTWEWVTSSDLLPKVREKFLVTRSARRTDGVLVRVVGDAPPAADAQPTTPTLEDAYLYHIDRDRRAEAA